MRGKYKNRSSAVRRADMIGQVRLGAWKYIRNGASKSSAFKKSWAEYKGNSSR